MSPPQFSFARARTTPTSSFLQNMCFYSAPSSPTRGMLAATSDLSTRTTNTITTSTKACEDLSSNFDDFEFETSRRFIINDDFKDDDSDSETQKSEVTVDYQQEEGKKFQREHHESLPVMAFADELFYDGKVMPLNPPPCQQYNFDKYSSCPTSPSNSSSLFKIPFARRSLWNDDFDPFMVALETVKEGNHRRALSTSPLRSCTHWNHDEFMDYLNENCLHASPLVPSPSKQMEPNGSATPMWTAKEGSKTPIKLAEPKGVLFARRARMVKMGYENKPTIVSPTPNVQAGENTGLGSTSSNKWHRIMSFRLESSSMSRTRNEHKHRDQNVEFPMPKIIRRLSFRSKKLVHRNEAKEVSQMTKLSLVSYRPKLLLCMGYGAKYTK
ncbi:hypothetical protein MANES_05G200100v8 [Manihot esculenta]|uniref:Uncharacterized protein n=1 Tax=Manihot esculenta TaxID=3983 RepID=A0ACB7HQL0_MANES|nr:hypothetical protein MANES_05G200100v8 [Manihot esculenta]